MTILEIFSCFRSTLAPMRCHQVPLLLALVACKSMTERENSSSQPEGGGVDPASLGPFSTITNESTADIDVTVGPPRTVTVACSDGPTSRVSLGVSGAMLTVKTPSNANPRCKVMIAIPSLTEIASNGTGTFAVHGNAAVAKVTADGTGAVSVEEIETDSLSVTSDGTGALTFAGKATTATFKLGGVGALSAKNLVADTVTLTLDGAGSASVNATKKADVTLEGVGSATVYGNPAEKLQKKRGLGTITFK